MSEKPSSKPPASKLTAKTAGNGSPAGASAKAKSSEHPDETFDFLAPAQAPGEIGRLAHYRVLKLLGKGGMGLVFMAEDTRLHRIVALKVMLPSIAKKEVARDRFMREARATAAMEHDHIVTIYEVNEDKRADQDVPYFAMQFLKGMSLEDWLKAGKSLNVPQILRIGKEIAKALAAAHACQLIHRDIKPSNIWLDAANKGRVKILDFGLARPTNEETHLTQEGMILGSPAYMSPEQARGQDVDERCDLFSLGCVLYRLCAGKLPFAGKDAMSMLLSITSDEPPALAKLNADLPPALAELVHQLLAKKPDDRPASAKAVVQAIQVIERDWVSGAKTIAARPVRQADGTAPAQETIAVELAADVDPALEESAITDLELQETPVPQPAPPAPRRGSWVFAGLGCSLLTVVSILGCLGVVIWTNHGEIGLVAEDAAAKTWLEDAGLTVLDHNRKAYTLNIGEPQHFQAGGYNVELNKIPRGFQVEPSQFLLHRGETLEIKVRYAPSKSNRPPLALVTSDDAKKIQQEWAVYLNHDIHESSKNGPKLVLVPPGEFLMGTRNDHYKQHWSELTKKFDKRLLPDKYLETLANEMPQHRVRITKPFYLGVNEVSFGQFSKFVSAEKYKTEPEMGVGGTGLVDGKDAGRKPEFTWAKPGYKPNNDAPVTNITWKDAEAYCAWLSKKEKKIYRLPTEAEWEYACRAGSTTLWAFADGLPGASARDYLWCRWPNALGKGGSNPAAPQVVGRKKANEFGLHDMHGNVAEMCSDYWQREYYERCVTERVAADPQGPDNNPGQGRIVRGGSFLDTVFQTRSAYRLALTPTLGYCQIGFRVVCEIPLPAE